MTTRATGIQAVAIAFLLASWVCFDPLVSARWGLDVFPYLPTALLAGGLIMATALVLRMHDLWREKDRWAVVVAVVAAQFSGFALGKLDVLELATFALFGFWLIQAFTERERPLQVSPLVFFIVALMFLAVLAFINHPLLTSYAAIGFKFLLFFLIVDWLRRRAIVFTAARLLIWTGVFSAVVALMQFVAFIGWGVVWTFGAPDGNPQSILKPTPFGMMVRAIAFFPNPAGLNDYLLFTLAVAAFAMTAAATRTARWGYLAAAVLMAAGIVVTWSAAALLGLGIMAVLFGYIYRPALAIHYSGVLVLGGIGAYLAGVGEVVAALLEGFGGGVTGSVRMDLLQLGIASLQRDPLIGLGIQNFGSFSGNFFPTGPYVFKYPVHNAFMQMATELGILGGLTFLGLVGFLTFRLLSVLNRCEREETWIFKGFLLGWSAIVLHMMTEPMAYEGTLWLIFGLIEGAALTVRRAADPMRAESNGA